MNQRDWEKNLREAASRAPGANAAWIVRRVEPGRRPSMLGPMSHDAVIEILRAGAISFVDEIWREGMRRWRKISELTEFGAAEKKITESEDSSVIHTSEEMLASVVRSRGTHGAAPIEERPPEADGDDLVPKPIWMSVVVVAILLSAFSPGSAFAATVLEISPLKLTTSEALLVFQTDASTTESIQVEMRGASGEILRLPSYHKIFQVRRSEGEVATLELGRLQLPSGTYTIDASVGGQRKSATVFLGTRDARFEEERLQHLKAIAQVQQTEKKTLFYSAQKMTRLAKRLEQIDKRKSSAGEWRKFYREFQTEWRASRSPVAGLHAKGESHLAFPEHINEFMTAASDLQKMAADADKRIEADDPRRDVAASARATTLTPKSAQSAFTQITRRAAKLSVQH